MGEVRRRLRDLLEQRGMSARQLAILTGDPEKTVQRWISGDTETIPADFIGRCEERGFASARWLLRNDGPVEAIPVTAQERAIQDIATIIDRVRRPTPPPESPGAQAADELEGSVRDATATDANQVEAS